MAASGANINPTGYQFLNMTRGLRFIHLYWCPITYI